MKEQMSKAGYDQGDMSPKVSDYQKPMKNYAESGFSRTTEYVERKDAHESKEANELRKIHYKGRYS